MSAMTDSEPVLATEGVSHAFGSVEVLDDVSVAVDPGTVTALIGPNGSGKTTLLRILAGVLSPVSGTVTYRGPQRDREIGYMPQQPSFRPGFSTHETLAFYTSFVGGEPAELLDRVGLGDAADRNVEALSGGMRRLLGIAQATVGDPPVVVLDEPGSGLDPGMRQRTFEVVRELADDGAAVLLSTHDLLNAEQYADQVVLLETGTVIASDTPGQLFEEYDCRSLQELFDVAISGEAGTVEVAGGSQ